MYHYVLLLGVLLGAVVYHKACRRWGYLLKSDAGTQADAPSEEASPDSVRRLHEEAEVLQAMVRDYKKNVNALGATIMGLEEDLLQCQEVIESKDQIITHLREGAGDAAANDAADRRAQLADGGSYNADVIVDLQREVQRLRAAASAAEQEHSEAQCIIDALEARLTERDTAGMDGLLRAVASSPAESEDVAELRVQLASAQQRAEDSEAAQRRLLEVLAQKEREAAAAGDSEAEILAQTQAAMMAKNRCIADLQRTVQEQAARLARLEDVGAAAPPTPTSNPASLAPTPGHSPDRKQIVNAAEEKLAAIKQRLARAQARRL
eukprot:TRINITY_DN13343_c0_g1_i1.p1 TRINITY_DN13343_c0_g1~~TRINITY_DN13343_c0_g1_i1.p1  ORF type:complete len:322 (+),score=125.08 TRINITY_DN13343_c0_g1_i1:58-1023(+)